MAEQGPLSGKILSDKYLLGDLLGEGGFGAVYSARHLLLNRPQAIKMLQSRHVREPRFRERFQREAQTLATLDHPHIVHIDDFVMEEHTALAYLVMPFVSEGTFRSILRKRAQPLSLEQVTRYLEQISSALDYAHRHGVAHLDLKPQNLLVHADGHLLLSDFGLAHLVKQEVLEGGSSLYHGTPQYMAPEHLRGQPDTRSDIYALGIILYEMLASQRPFEGSNPEAIMLKQLTAQPPLLSEKRPELPLEMDEIIQRVLAKATSTRYQSAGELLAAFRHALALQEERLWRDEQERLRAMRDVAEQEQLARLEEAHRRELESMRRKAVEAVAERDRLLREKEEMALKVKRQPLDGKEYELRRKAQTREELEKQLLDSESTDVLKSLSIQSSVRQLDGKELLGADHPRSAQLGLIYPGPTDSWPDVQAALYRQDKQGRKHIVIILPPKGLTFNWRRDFAELDTIRQNFQAQFVFIIPASANAANFAELYHFSVYPTLDHFRQAFLAGRLPGTNKKIANRDAGKNALTRLLRKRASIYLFLFTLPCVSLVLALLSFFPIPALIRDSAHSIFYLAFGLFGAILPAASFFFPGGSKVRFGLLIVPVVVNAFLLLYCPIMAVICLLSFNGAYQSLYIFFPISNYAAAIIFYLLIALPPALLMASIYLSFFSAYAEIEAPQSGQ